MDAIVSVDPNTIPINAEVYAVFYPYDGFVQTCDTLEDAFEDIIKARDSIYEEDQGASVVKITVREVYRNGRR